MNNCVRQDTVLNLLLAGHFNKKKRTSSNVKYALVSLEEM